MKVLPTSRSELLKISKEEYESCTHRKCSICKEVKSVYDFGFRDRKRKNGLVPRRAECKQCRVMANRDWDKRNIEHVKKCKKKWVQENREKHNASGERWRKANPEKVLNAKTRRRYRQKYGESVPDVFIEAVCMKNKIRRKLKEMEK